MPKALKGFLKYFLIALCIWAVILGLYFLTMMRPKPLLSLFENAAPPAAVQVIQYMPDRSEITYTAEGKEAVAPLYEAMENSKARFLRSFSAAVAPKDGYYYEIFLYETSTEDEKPLVAFGGNTDGEIIILRAAYQLTKDSPFLPALDTFLTENEGTVTLTAEEAQAMIDKAMAEAEAAKD